MLDLREDTLICKDNSLGSLLCSLTSVIDSQNRASQVIILKVKVLLERQEKLVEKIVQQDCLQDQSS